MPPTEPIPTCRRKALWSVAFALACLLASWLGYGHVPDHTAGLLAGMGAGALFAAVLLWFTPDLSDALPKRLIRRYQRDIAGAMSAYVVVMLVWKQLLHAVDATWLRVLIALLPVALVGLVLRAYVIYVRDSDEMQRRIELESGAIAGLIVSAGYMAAGFLQSADLIAVPAKLAMLWVFPALCLAYGVAKVVIARRYL